MRQPIIHVHIADIHFGAIDPKTQFDILQEQFLNRIVTVPFNILAIDGDLFDRKFSTKNEAVTYAIEFVNRCLNMCLERNAILIMISGTKSHEADQLSLFEGYQRMYPNNVYIINHISWVYAFGYKILCIPEEYGQPPEYYESKLREAYDMVFMHGTLVGGVFGANKERLDSTREPVFSIDSFSGCKGPIISGHVHKSMCLNSYMYYVSNPIRYRFGEEEHKGFAICISSDNGHYYHFERITSFRYVTVSLSEFKSNDPEYIVSQLDKMKANGIDYIRLDLRDVDERFSSPIVAILDTKYAQNPYFSIMKPTVSKEAVQVQTANEISAKYEKFEFLLDPKLGELEKFIQYVNYYEGSDFITIDRLKQVLGC